MHATADKICTKYENVFVVRFMHCAHPVSQGNGHQQVDAFLSTEDLECIVLFHRRCCHGEESQWH